MTRHSQRESYSVAASFEIHRLAAGDDRFEATLLCKGRLEKQTQKDPR